MYKSIKSNFIRYRIGLFQQITSLLDLFLLISYFHFMCMSVLPTNMYMHHVCMCVWCPQKPEEDIRPRVTAVPDDCEPPLGCQESKLGYLKEQSVLFCAISPALRTTAQALLKQFKFQKSFQGAKQKQEVSDCVCMCTCVFLILNLI